MKPATAAAMAACLEQLAAVLREEGEEKPKAQRRKLTIVAAEKGIPASTLRELIRLRLIPAARVGRGRGVWLVDPDAVEEYFEKQTTRTRGQLREVVAT